MNKQEFDELVQLKKNKQSGIMPEPAPKEPPVEMTRKEKFDNFLYHYKTTVIGWTIAIICFIGMFVPAFFVDDYDMVLMIATSTPRGTTQDAVANGLSTAVPDFDQNGKSVMGVKMYQVAFTDTTANEMVVAEQAMLFVDLSLQENFLIALDMPAYEQLVEANAQFVNMEELFPNAENVDGDKHHLKDSYFSELVNLGALYDDIFLCMMDVSEFEGNDKDIKQQRYNDQLEFLKILLKL